MHSFSFQNNALGLDYMNNACLLRFVISRGIAFNTANDLLEFLGKVGMTQQIYSIPSMRTQVLKSCCERIGAIPSCDVICRFNPVAYLSHMWCALRRAICILPELL